MANKTFKLFADKMGGREASQYIGTEGEIFYDPTTVSLRISNGTTPGGVAIAGGDVVSPLNDNFTISTSYTSMGSPPGPFNYTYTFGADGTLTVPGHIVSNTNITLRSGEGYTTSIEGSGGGGTIEIGYQAEPTDIGIGTNGAGTTTTVWSDYFRILATAPTTSKGSAGDQAGSIAFSASHAYFCTGSYTNGVADIWKRVALTGGAW